MVECNFNYCGAEATVIVAEVYTTGAGGFMDISSGVFCDFHLPPCCTPESPGARDLWKCRRAHLVKPISSEELPMTAMHGGERTV